MISMLENSIGMSPARMKNLHDIIYVEIFPEVKSGKVGEAMQIIADRRDLSDVEKVYCGYQLAKDVMRKKDKGFFRRKSG